MCPIGPAPDWQDVTWMVGNYGGTPTLVALDEQGRMYAVLYGAVAIDGPVDVNQLDKTREVQGTDGVVLRTLALDELGRIITLMKGMYGSTLTNVAVDAAGRMITVLRDPVSNNYIAVDASGQIVAVMKGLYGAVLKSIAVDSQGRMIMIPTDPADVWGNAISMGNAEVVACLTPAKRYDHRGSVLMWDSFESGIAAYSTTVSGTGAAVGLTTAYSRTGAFSVKMAAGSVANDYVYLYRALPYPILSKGGFEVSFSYGANISLCGIRYRLYDGTNYYQGSLIWDLPNTKLKYLNSGGGYTDLLTGLKIYTGVDLFHTLKLVIDWSTKKYVRAMFNEREVAMTNIALYQTASALAPHILAYFVNISAGGALNTCYTDDWIITQNEPS